MTVKLSILMFFIIAIIGCKKETPETQTNTIPEGATAFTDNDIQFVPYTSESPMFKDQLDNPLTLNFIERKRSEEYFAWDQTYFSYSTDENLKIELRLRFLQSDVSKKTLAIYMPYYDNSNVLRNNLFEMPIDYSGIENGFFKNIIDFHDTLVINSVERYNVYEVRELVSTDVNKDGPQNCNRLFYNRTEGIIEIRVKDGVIWTLQ